MKATRTEFGRTIRFTDLPKRYKAGGRSVENEVRELDVLVQYTGHSNVDRAVLLDNVVIPAILRAFRAKKKPKKLKDK